MSHNANESYHHGDLPNALVDAALLILSRDGAEGLNLREVAKIAGVSHTAPYRHFKNKMALLEAIAIRGYAQLEDACRTAYETYPNDPNRQLIEAGMGYLTLVLEKPELAHLMFSGVLTKKHTSKPLNEAGNKAVQSLGWIVENGKQQGLYSDHPTEKLTLAALAYVHGIAMMLLGGLLAKPETKQQLKLLAMQLGDAMLHGLLKR